MKGFKEIIEAPCKDYRVSEACNNTAPACIFTFEPIVKFYELTNICDV